MNHAVYIQPLSFRTEEEEERYLKIVLMNFLIFCDDDQLVDADMRHIQVGQIKKTTACMAYTTKTSSKRHVICAELFILCLHDLKVLSCKTVCTF